MIEVHYDWISIAQTRGVSNEEIDKLIKEGRHSSWKVWSPNSDFKRVGSSGSPLLSLEDYLAIWKKHIFPKLSKGQVSGVLVQNSYGSHLNPNHLEDARNVLGLISYIQGFGVKTAVFWRTQEDLEGSILFVMPAEGPE